MSIQASAFGPPSRCSTILRRKRFGHIVSHTISFSGAWCSAGEVTAEASRAKERSDEGYSGSLPEDGEGEYQYAEGVQGNADIKAFKGQN